MAYKEFDVIIVGGGINGLCTAALLKDLDLSVALIDRGNIKSRINKRIDGRGIALAKGSEEILKEFNLWQGLANKGGEIKKIAVLEPGSTHSLQFDTSLVQQSYLGLIIEMDDLCKHFYDAISSQDNITICDQESVEYVDANANNVLVKTSYNQYKSNLLIAADGKDSFIKKLLRIESFEHDYSQIAAVFNIQHSSPNKGVAWECFYNNGPFAVLPLREQSKSSIVWVENKQHKDLFAQSGRQFLEAILNERLKDSHGKIGIATSIFTYPLSLKLAKKYYQERILFLGDSLHYMHPIAGQGFNLSLRDIYSLRKLVKKYLQYGLDYGSITLFEEFCRDRKIDNYSMAAITNSLNGLFSSNINMVRLACDLGLEVVNNFPALQKFFMNYAMGKRKIYDTNT